jgi:hypothetical protein
LHCNFWGHFQGKKHVLYTGKYSILSYLYYFTLSFCNGAVICIRPWVELSGFHIMNLCTIKLTIENLWFLKVNNNFCFSQNTYFDFEPFLDDYNCFLIFNSFLRLQYFYSFFKYCSLYSCLLSCVRVTIDGVWIGEWIYWPLTGHNYKLL